MRDVSIRRRRNRGRLAGAAVPIALWLTGCPSAPPPAPGTGATAAGTAVPEGDAALGPLEILRRSAAAYRAAPRYEDRGVLRLRFKQGGQPFEQVLAPAALTLERPGKLRLHYNTVKLVADGRTLTARIELLPEQVLRRETAEPLSLQWIDEDPVVQQYLGGADSLARQLLGLFVLDHQPFLDKLAGKVRRLPAAVWENRPCYRVEAADDGRKFVYWVDQESSLIRRVELPAETWRSLYDPAGQMQDLTVALELDGAAVPAAIPAERFVAEPDGGARVVRRLLDRRPPSPLDPRLGKPCPDFVLLDVAAKPVRPAEWKGQVTIVAAWATWCDLCRRSLPELLRYRASLGADAPVRFCFVNVDEANVPLEKVDQARAAFGPGGGDYRDADGSFRKVFGVEYLPVVLILDADGIVQRLEVGLDERLTTELPERIAALRAGKQLHVELAARHKQEQASWEQALLAAAAQAGPAASGPIPKAEIPPAAPAQAPRRLEWEAVWTCNELRAPGNLTVVEGEGAPRLYCLDGTSAGAELDAAGKVVRKLTAPWPEGTFVVSLAGRTGTDGPSFVAYAPGQPKAYALDRDWKKLGEFAGVDRESFAAATVTKSARGPETVLAGYGGYGVQAFSRLGERRWAYRKSEDVLDLAVVPAPGGEFRLLVTNSKGALVVLDGDGRQTAEHYVGKTPARPLGRLLQYAAGQEVAGRISWAGIARDAERANILVGIGPQGDELWSCNLAAGDHLEPIPALLPCTIEGISEGCWLVPGPGGVLQFVSGNGELLDTLALGMTAGGLATMRVGNQSWVIVSGHVKHENYRLTAYRVRLPAAPR